MIDVLKRLAQLDAKNPSVVKESTKVQECGPMGMMDSMPGMHGMMAEKPSVPANFSINASAASGTEVADMMSQILTLAGLNKVGPDDLGAEPQGALVTAEPGVSVGPMAAEPMPSAADSMRSVLDKLNPEPAGDDSGEELGPFQHNSDEPEGGDSDSDAGPDTGAEPEFGNDQGEEDSEEADDEEDQEETDEGQYDNSPADANSANPFDSEEQAHHENQPGAGETANGEKRQSNLPTATFEGLMKAYKQFIGEGDEEKPGKEEDMDEDVTDRLKDLDPKNPVNIPAYQRKAKSGDSAQAARKESVEETCSTCHKDPCGCDDKKVEESTLDILKLAGLK